MSWLDDWKKQCGAPQEDEKQQPLISTCPECMGKALIWCVKKGKNKGRPILYCEDKMGCKLVKFMDLPQCSFCGEEKYEAMTRGGKNKGRIYRQCPNRCSGSFEWR